MKHVTLTLSIAFLLLIGLAGAVWAFGDGELQPCALHHRVRRGETLSGIAARYGMDTTRLAAVNGLADPDRIRVGQRLCIPATDSLPPSALVLTAVYHFAPTAAAVASADTTPEGWTLGRDGRAGRERRYPLLSGNRIHTYAMPEEVREASLTARTEAVLWLTRHAAETEAERGYGYTLVVIGGAAPLLDLQLGFTRSWPDILAADRIPDDEAGLDRCVRRGALPLTALAPAGTVTAVKLEARLVAGDGSLLPLDITTVDYFPTPAEAERYYRCPGLALHALRRPAQAGYELHMVLNEEGAGPPGPQWRPRCRNWLGTNWWSRFLRFFYRC